MAKSKSGGTRSYIRGRVGADVYSIGRDAKGAKQQVVRSLAETVANPQTVSQMRGRMIMSTVMQAVSAMRPIIDHSFDNVPAGQPSISEFISRNYALIKADVAAHPANANSFGLSAYQEKGVKVGAYVISSGDKSLPAAVAYSSLRASVALSTAAHTVGDFKSALGFGEGDYITFLRLITDEGGAVNFEFFRLSVKDGVADTTEITTGSIATIFDIEGNINPTLTAEDLGDGYKLAWANDDGTASACGVIISYKNGSGFVHTPCAMASAKMAAQSADIILPTYPTGSEMFLNGGDI